MVKRRSSERQSKRPESSLPLPAQATRVQPDGQHNTSLFLILILTVAALLRFGGLDNQSLWNDELHTWEAVHRESLSEVFQKGIRVEVHPPLYFIFMYYWQKYVGDTETLLRLPSAVAGVLAVFAIYLVGRRLYSDREGLIAAALTAVMHCPIRYSQEARPYAMLLLFSLLATYYWLSVAGSLSEGKRPKTWETVAFIVAAVLTSYTHYFGLYYVGLLGVAGSLMMVLKRRWFQGLVYFPLVYVPVALSYIPWLETLSRHLRMRSFWIPAPTPRAPYQFLRFALNHSPYVVVVFLALCMWLLGITLYRFLRKKQPAPTVRSPISCQGLMLLLWLVVPFVGAYIRSVVSTPVLWGRNLIISVPAAYLLAARAVTQIPVRARWHALIAGGLSLALLFHLEGRLHYYSAAHKEQFREVVKYVITRDPTLKDTLIMEYTWGENFFNYYFIHFGSERRVDLKGGRNRDIEEVAAEIQRRSPRFIWFIFAHRPPEEGFMQFMQRNYRLMSFKRFYLAGVARYENEPPSRRR